MKFPEDIWDNIEKHLDWNWAEELKTIVKNEKCIPDVPKYKWEGNELTNILNMLIDKNKTTEKEYNKILRRIVNTIFELNNTPQAPHECEIKKINRQLDIFRKCASKRPYNQNTLEYICGRFKNLLNRHLSYGKLNINQFVHIESNLIELSFCTSHKSTIMYYLLSFYMYYFNKMFHSYYIVENRVVRIQTSLNINEKPIMDMIIYLIGKINGITEDFIIEKKLFKFKDTKIKEFKELYFKELSHRDPYKQEWAPKVRIFLGNVITQKLLNKIDEMIVARENRRKMLLDEKRKRNIPLTQNEKLKIPSFTREEKEVMSEVLSLYIYDTTPPRSVFELLKI
jgi:hypothetical protein